MTEPRRFEFAARASNGHPTRWQVPPVDWSVYIDDSWSGNGQVFTLAAYIAPTHEWKQVFDHYWRAMLAAASLAEFKTSDCRQRQQSCRGWHKHQSDSLMRQAVSIINDTVPHADMIGYAASVALPGRVEAVARRRWEKASLLVSVTWALRNIIDVCIDVMPKGGTLRVFIDKKEGFKKTITDQLETIWQRAGGSTAGRTLVHDASCSSHEHPGLQAADLFAYETSHEAMHRMQGDSHSTSRALLALLAGRHHQANCVWYNDLLQRMELHKTGQPIPQGGTLLFRSDYPLRDRDQWPYRAPFEFNYSG